MVSAVRTGPVPVVSVVSFRWFRSGVSMVSAVRTGPVPVVSFRWFRFGVSGFSTSQIFVLCDPVDNNSGMKG